MDGPRDVREIETSDRTDRVITALAEPLSPVWAEIPAGGENLQQEPENTQPSVETAIVLELSVALLADPPTQLTMIRVDNEEGIVTLTGEVGNSEVRRMVEEIASSHPGVASAINDLQISSPGVTQPEPEKSKIDEKEETDDHRTFL